MGKADPKLTAVSVSNRAVNQGVYLFGTSDAIEEPATAARSTGNDIRAARKTIAKAACLANPRCFIFSLAGHRVRMLAIRRN